MTERIFDYFAVIGLPFESADEYLIDSNQIIDQEKRNDFLKSKNHQKAPIVDLALVNRTLGEYIPIEYECLFKTPSGYSANLGSEQNEMYLLIKRGHDKPPIESISFYLEEYEQVTNGCIIIKKTIGNNSANFQLSNKNAFIIYKRSENVACNSLAMADVCIINKKHGEEAPHTFHESRKNITDVDCLVPFLALCFRKSFIKAPQIKYNPSILYRYPKKDHSDFSFPDKISHFSMPMSATVESWPELNEPSILLTNLKPVFNTFVFNSNEKKNTEKVYGSVITFYEDFDKNWLNGNQSQILKYKSEDQKHSLHSNKSLVILSRFNLFDTYKSFLLFLFDKFSFKINFKSSQTFIASIERYLYHLIFEVPFPTLKMPHILVYLTELDKDYLSINLPPDSVLPQSAASFVSFIHILNVENTIKIFLFSLLGRNLLIHSIRRSVLTSVVETISSMIFPFILKNSYFSNYPLSLGNEIKAPLVAGVETSFFDLHDPPKNFVCVDLDTNGIFCPAEKIPVSLSILPKKIYFFLKEKLTQIFSELKEFLQINNLNKNLKNSEANFKKKMADFELSIREVFLKAMVFVLRDFKNYVQIESFPKDLEVIDRNLNRYFNVEKFLESVDQSEKLFYQELIKTELFFDCVLNLTFPSKQKSDLAQPFIFFLYLHAEMSLNGLQDNGIKLKPFNNNRDCHTKVFFSP